jgi:hypothetical protein
MSFATCYVLFTCYEFFNYSFYVCFLVLYVLLSILCVLCFCTLLCIVSPMYIVVYFLLVYNFTDRCHWVETQLHLINIITYHIIYYVTSKLLIYVILPGPSFLRTSLVSNTFSSK